MELGYTFHKVTKVGDRWIKTLMGAYKCHCGNDFVARVNNVKIGKTKTCGCLRAANLKQGIRYKHGMSREPIYTSWIKMKARCTDESRHNYKAYGGRGISVCDEWINDAKKFIEWALENGYKQGKHLHRVNNDLGYSPDNCVFLTPQEHIEAHLKWT